MATGGGTSRAAVRRVTAVALAAAVALGLAGCGLLSGGSGESPAPTSTAPTSTVSATATPTDGTTGGDAVGTLLPVPTTDEPTDVTPPTDTAATPGDPTSTASASPQRPVPQYVKDRIAGVESQGYSQCEPWWSDAAKYWVINCLDPYGRHFQLPVTP